MAHLLLQLENSVHESLTGRWASWDVDIDRDNSVTTSGDGVRVVVVTTTVSTGTHGNDPSWFWHLIVNLTKGRSHLVGEGTSHNHDIGLTRRSTENDTESVLIVSWGRKMHHLDGTASKTESHGPERSLTSPVGNLIESSKCILHNTLLALLTWQWDLTSLLAGDAHGWWSSRVAVDIVLGGNGTSWLRGGGRDGSN